MELSPTRALRRTLEKALSAEVASSVLFEALGAAGVEVPQTVEEVLAVVGGPLRDALARRLELEWVDRLIAQIKADVEPRDPRELETVQMPLDELDDEDGREGDATTPFSTAHEAVRVLVLAGKDGFARRLEATLGSDRVCPIPISSPLGLMELVSGEAPAILIVDAADFPAIETTAILSAGFAVPRTTACVLWGSELPYGKSFVKAVDAQRRNWMTLEMREGIAPLLDLISSRRRRRP